jgi:leader peptidase (prepilin peptidase)/N-methyltransferase
MTALRIAIALPLGLAFGSFLTVVVYRVPRGESVVHPRSRCPSCGVTIREIDNIPVVSWLLLRGSCRGCGARISPIYPLLELGSGVLFVAVSLTVEDPWLAGLEAPFAALLVAIAIIDWRTKKIPNAIVYPSLLVWTGAILLARLAGGEVDVLRAGLGFLAYGGGLLIVAFIAPRGMGMGDVKLAALIGLVLGAHGLSDVAVAAGAGIALGGVAAVGALLAGASRKQGIPYGPFMAAGALIAIFFGRVIADAYLSLLS